MGEPIYIGSFATWITSGIIIVGLATVILSKRKKNEPKFRSISSESKIKISIEKDNSSVDQQIKSKLSELQNRYHSDFLAYALRNIAESEGFSIQDRKILYEKYGAVYATPTINWGDEFSFLGKELKRRETVIKSYLEEKGFQGRIGEVPTDAFKNWMYDSAYSDAQKIIADFKKMTS